MTPQELKDKYAAGQRDFRGANLRGANLRGADLRGANLRGADLRIANLRIANLYSADLRGANLHSANLHSANLHSADLRGANLHSANLHSANLDSANLDSAKVEGAKNFRFQIIPETGDFIAWKKLRGDVVAELLVPAKAKRVCTPVGRKCRAEYVKVLRLHWPKHVPAGQRKAAVGGLHRHTTIYRVGKITRPDSFDPDIRVECSYGIHFFVTRAEAEAWS